MRLTTCECAATRSTVTYPDGSDAEEVFLDIGWWVNKEVVHHGAEIALLRDRYLRRPATVEG